MKGKTPTEIANWLGHSLSSIERYLSDFARVLIAQQEKISPLKTSRVTNLSEKFVKEYIDIIEKFSKEENYQQIFQSIKERFGKKKEVILL